MTKAEPIGGFIAPFSNIAPATGQPSCGIYDATGSMVGSVRGPWPDPVTAALSGFLAASFDMLKALKEIRELSDYDSEIGRAAREAIAKAEGGPLPAESTAAPTPTVADDDDLLFSLRAWGGDQPDTEAVADELERIAGMLRDGFTSGEAMTHEDFDGTGWWNCATA